MSIAALRNRVLKYHDEHGRHTLPWRKTRDPYKIMVSEIMLQQTQVDRVVPFFKRFIKEFPTLDSLAQAPRSSVLRLWSGLGYNRRAKMLHEAAKKVVTEFNAVIPKELDSLRSLPGIGPYTAGAIRAFAFNLPEVFVETNIRTVLIHHLCDSTQSVHDDVLREMLKKMVPKHNARIFYAAMMDYGTHLKAQGIAAHQRSKHFTKQSQFKGSLREVRGAILKAELAGKALGPLKKKFGDRFRPAKKALQKEGLI